MTPIKKECTDERCKLGTWEGVVSSVMAIIIIVVGFSWWCSSLDGRVGSNTVSIETNKQEVCKRIEKVEITAAANREMIQVLTVSTAKQDEKYIHIKESLDKIERMLEADKGIK